MVDVPAVRAAVRELLVACGLDPDDTELVDTPARVADAARELFAGVGSDPLEVLGETLPAPAHDLVAMSGIRVRSLCAHHLLPVYGTADLAYVPGERIAGLGALPRLVGVLAARPQLQERLAAQIADALMVGLGARGAIVRLRLHQDCVSARGARQDDARTTSISARGSLAGPAGVGVDPAGIWPDAAGRPDAVAPCPVDRPAGAASRDAGAGGPTQAAPRPRPASAGEETA